jgi:hypothetical protein
VGGKVRWRGRQARWVREVCQVGWSGRFGLVWSGRLLIQHNQSLTQSVTKVGIELPGQLKIQKSIRIIKSYLALKAIKKISHHKKLSSQKS